MEKALVASTALHLCFLPWALGAMTVWSQLTSLGLALMGLVLAIFPRTTRDEFHHEISAPHWPAARLWRSPVIWAGLVFLGYITIQGLNPAWVFQSNDDSWWLEPLDPVTWLPSSVDAPFERSNAWRSLVIFGSLATLVTSVWVGFTRRKSYHALFTVLATNAGILALFGVVQRLSGTKLIFWSYASSNDSFAASFIYPNHAGPYFYLMVALSIGLAWWHDQRSRHQLENPGPAFLFILFAAVSGSMVILTYSRTSITLLLVLMLFFSGGLAYRFFRRKGPAQQRPELLYLTLTLAAFLGIGLATLHTEKAWKRFTGLVAHPAAAARDRTLARHAATDMLHEHWLFGWGAGCFRYGFPKYSKQYPAIYYEESGERKTWEHAHNDLLEFPVEYGVVGLLPVAGILGFSVWKLCRRRFWRNVVSRSLLFGCALIMLHAWVDFVFQNPAVLLTWSVLLAGALRWTELDRPGGRKPPANFA